MSAGDLDTFTPDKLLAGSQQVQTKSIIVDTGVLARGSVLGRIKTGTIPTTGTAGSNTGTGAMTAVAAKRRIKVGVYTMTCVQVIANSGVFKVIDPDGKLVGMATVGVAFLSDQIGFSISDATDFIAGDSFTVTIPAASTEKYVLVDKAAIDGSGVADCILAESVDATSADVTTVGYKTGQFNRAALVVAAANTVAEHEADLRVNDINLKDVMA